MSRSGNFRGDNRRTDGRLLYPCACARGNKKVIVGILHQNFRLSLTLSLLHIIIKESLRYNLVFVP